MSGFTGKHGTFHSEQAIKYGTQLVGGVTPKRRSETFEFTNIRYCSGSKRQTNADASMIYVPPICCRCNHRAINAKIDLIVCITEGIPVLDMLKVKTELAKVNQD